MQKLRAWLPGQQSSTQAPANRHSVALEPEIGFQITIETQKAAQQNDATETSFAAAAAKSSSNVPELNVHLIAARHLPSLFGFKIVQGYLVKVKLFPGTKRLDSSIQTNTWPKFNENFKFPLVPDIKPSLKLKTSSAFASRRSTNGNQQSSDDPEDLFTGQFVVFTVYALLELPAASFNRFNKTYRSLKDKSSNFMQRIVENSTSNSDETKVEGNGSSGEAPKGKGRRKSENPRDPMPPLTVSESRRNIGSVTCYLEPKLFKRNPRNGSYTSDELWLPIKDITTTVTKATPSNNTNLINSPKGVVEVSLEVRDLSEPQTQDVVNGPAEQPPSSPVSLSSSGGSTGTALGSSSNTLTPAAKNWQRMAAEVKRKMGISNAGNASNHNLVLLVTTARMRCSHKVKDELEATAGSVYVKTTVFEHGIYQDAWKSPSFYPSLSTKWEGSTLQIPLKSIDQLENIVVRTTLATKLKMGKKLVLGTVLVGASAQATSTGLEQLRLLQEAPLNERISAWHCYH